MPWLVLQEGERGMAELQGHCRSEALLLPRAFFFFLLSRRRSQL